MIKLRTFEQVSRFYKHPALPALIAAREVLLELDHRSPIQSFFRKSFHGN